MIGPRGLNRSPKAYERPADPAEIVAGKSFFTFQRWGSGFALNIHRRGAQVETVLVHSEAELNRKRRELSDNGLVGINEVDR